MSEHKMEQIHQPYTLQTWAGMVQNSGLPAHQWLRKADLTKPAPLSTHQTVTLPSIGAAVPPNNNNNFHITSYQSFTQTPWSSPHHAPIPETAITCLHTNTLPNRALIRAPTDRDADRYISNVQALRNPATSIHRLTTLIRHRTRLTLEQAAGAVVAALVHHDRLADAETLVRELTGVLAVAHVGLGWGAAGVARTTLASAAAEAFGHLAARAQVWCSRAVERRGGLGADAPRDYRELVGLLLRVRRAGGRGRRCLYIPRWMFEEAGIEPRGGHAAYLDGYEVEMEERGQFLDVLRGYRWPEEPARDDSIVLSKHSFRTLQRGIFRLYRFWDPVVRLRRGVRGLEERVLYASGWIERQVRETDDVAKVAFWFFGHQRRLQLKVVSDDQWTRFLAKGEGVEIYQNNLKMKSTFEQALARIAGLELDSLTNGGLEDTLGLIDETCLLMKDYVDVYGQGHKENLVFKQGVSGGSGRGAVNEYNMLCVILRELKSRAKAEGIEEVPGPVYKFLAKDIMSWNKSWADDAFANGKVHGWEEWVKKRGLV
jgi:hypothetical protein